MESRHPRRQLPTRIDFGSLGFDVPVSGFLYSVYGSTVAAVPSEIRFNTLANGGLFDVTNGSGLNAAEFSFEGAQAFSGSTSVPTFSAATCSISNVAETRARYKEALKKKRIAHVDRDGE